MMFFFCRNNSNCQKYINREICDDEEEFKVMVVMMKEVLMPVLVLVVMMRMRMMLGELVAVRRVMMKMVF